jgi:sugar phosphate isomerase/epimerase
MTDWPIGLSTGCFYRTSIFETLDMVRESGLSILEVCSSREHLDYHDIDKVKRAAAEIGKRGLECFSFHAPFGAHIDISAVDEGERKRALNDVLAAVEAAATLGVRYFVLHPGPEESERPPAQEYLHRLSNASRSLREVATRCREKGVTLALENMLPHLLFGQMPDLFWLLGTLMSHPVGLCLDTGHAFLADILYPAIDKLSAHLLMVHAADNHGERDDHLPPGKGDIEWGRVVEALDRTGFRGPLILEIAGRKDDDPKALLQKAVEARQFLRGL